VSSLTPDAREVVTPRRSRNTHAEWLRSVGHPPASDSLSLSLAGEIALFSAEVGGGIEREKERERERERERNVSTMTRLSSLNRVTVSKKQPNSLTYGPHHGSYRATPGQKNTRRRASVVPAERVDALHRTARKRPTRDAFCHTRDSEIFPNNKIRKGSRCLVWFHPFTSIV
jgi:hypothetical protein